MTPLPSGPFATIVADPPWPMVWRGGANYRTNGRGERRLKRATTTHLPYATMDVDAIAAMPVGSIAATAAHLFLWAPDHFVIDGSATRVATAWGFEPLRFIVWAKAGFGLGRFPRPQHELILMARRGGLPFASVHDVGSVQRWKSRYGRVGASAARIHSAKPEGSYTLIERVSPGPYLELFGRGMRLGWTIWGDEATVLEAVS